MAATFLLHRFLPCSYDVEVAAIFVHINTLSQCKYVTFNYSRTIDFSNRVVLHFNLKVSLDCLHQANKCTMRQSSGAQQGRRCFQGDFGQTELEGAREVSGLTFSSAPTSCTSPSSCSLSLWIQDRGGSRGHREREDGRRRLGGGTLAWTGSGNFRCMFQLVLGWEGFGVGKGGGGYVGVLGLGNKPATAGSLVVSHRQKKQC